jgi:hypothetical protein
VARLTSILRNRLLPAVLTATGVSLIAAGLLTYSAPVEAGPGPEDSPAIVELSPTPTIPLPTFPPASGSPALSPSPSASAVAPADRVATRVVVPALKIDLPVIKPRGGPTAYPQCDVAMYLMDSEGLLKQPGQGAATYLYAHARDGMFGPIYHYAIETKKPKKMLGMVVQVYTSDDQLFTYYITKVLVHQTNLNAALNAKTEQVWLQTSEGPKGTVGKTQVLAELLTVGSAESHAAAHPAAHPVNCG